MQNILLQIAKNNLFIKTLETQNSDSLDFHDVSVWAIKKALEEAYKAGQMSSEEKPEAKAPAPEVVKFSKGNIYEMSFIGDSDLKVKFICTKTTPKTATFEKFKGSEKITRKINTRNGVEFVNYGNYSMTPSISANKIVG